MQYMDGKKKSLADKHHLHLQKGAIMARLRIVTLGSRGAILDLYWFLNYPDIKLVIQASEIEGKGDLLSYFKH